MTEDNVRKRPFLPVKIDPHALWGNPSLLAIVVQDCHHVCKNTNYSVISKKNGPFIGPLFTLCHLQIIPLVNHLTENLIAALVSEVEVLSVARTTGSSEQLKGKENLWQLME